jgi:hypothetical protein
MSAVLKPKKLETIFDHNISDSELSALLFGDTESFDEYTQFLDQNSAYADISRLYRLRGDDNTAIRYVNLISDNTLKNQFATTPCAVAGHFVAEQLISA